MRGSRKFCQRGPTLTPFLVDDGREDPNTTTLYMRPIIGPPVKHHLNHKMAFRWRAADDPTSNAGLVAL